MCEGKGSGDTAIPNVFNPPFTGDSSKVMNIISASSSKDELAGATKGQPSTRAAPVESAKL